MGYWEHFSSKLLHTLIAFLKKKTCVCGGVEVYMWFVCSCPWVWAYIYHGTHIEVREYPQVSLGYARPGGFWELCFYPHLTIGSTELQTRATVSGFVWYMGILIGSLCLCLELSPLSHLSGSPMALTVQKSYTSLEPTLFEGCSLRCSPEIFSPKTALRR